MMYGMATPPLATDTAAAVLAVKLRLMPGKAMADRAVNVPVCGPETTDSVFATNECLGPGSARAERAVNVPACGPEATDFAEKLYRLPGVADGCNWV